MATVTKAQLQAEVEALRHNAELLRAERDSLQATATRANALLVELERLREENPRLRRDMEHMRVEIAELERLRAQNPAPAVPKAAPVLRHQEQYRAYLADARAESMRARTVVRVKSYAEWLRSQGQNG